MKHSDQSPKMVIYDWYDGPVGGIVILDDARVFCFFMLDWDSKHRVRIFALQAVSDAVNGMINEFTSEPPKWPVWFPSELVHPSDRSREWTSSVRALRSSPERIDEVLVWDTVDEHVIAIRQVSPEAGNHAVPWFDAVEIAEGPVDWFELLSIPRR